MRRYSWPISDMLQWYADGATCDEIAARLPPMMDQAGNPARATGRSVGRVLRRNKCQMRPTGALGARNRAWRGGRIVDKDGYVLLYCPDHPAATAAGYVREHRLVAEHALGRYLRAEEVVHHRDDNPANNSADNLEVFASNGEHLRHTRAAKIPQWSVEGRRALSEAQKRRWQQWRNQQAALAAQPTDPPASAPCDPT